MSKRAEGLSRLAKAAGPTLIGLLGVVVLALPIRPFYDYVPTPVLPLIVVYFWTLYAPHYLPAPSVFMIGIFQDFLTGAPPGLWAAVYLFTQYIILSQRSYFVGRELSVVWVGFGFAAVSSSLILWLVMSLMSGQLLPVFPLFLQMATTVVCFPLFSGVFARLHRRVIVEG